MATINYPDKNPGDLVTSGNMNNIKSVVNTNDDALAPGISIAKMSVPTAQTIGTAYEQICLTDTLVFETPPGVIETTFPGGCDSVKLVKGGIVVLEATIYLEGAKNVEIFMKAYKNGVAISPGDPVGINMQGANKPVALPFSSHLPAAAGDVITYYAKLESAGTFTINSSNVTWEQTNY